MGCLESRDNKVKMETTLPPPVRMTQRVENILTSATENDIIFDDPIDSASTNTLMYDYDQLFSESEQAKSAEFTNSINQLKQILAAQNVEHSFNDSYLYRFLKQSQFNPSTTATKIKNHIQLKIAANDFIFWESDAVQDIFPHGFHKTDKQGRPIFICAIRNMDFKELFQVTFSTRMEKHIQQILEYLVNQVLIEASKSAQKYVEKHIIIVDIKDLKLKVAEAKQLFQIFADMATTHFPETLERIYVLNSPANVQNYWKQIGQLMNSTTSSKVSIIGSEFKKIISNIVDKENLPDFLGGESDTQGLKLLRKNIGPWNPNGEAVYFPHENPAKVSTVTEDQKQQLAADIDEYWNKKLSAQMRSSVKSNSNRFSEINTPTAAANANGANSRYTNGGDESVSSRSSISQSILSDI